MEMSRTEISIDPDIQELVPGFCASRKKDIASLDQYLAKGDFNSIAKISHTVKGIAAPYGFPTLEKLFKSLEVAAKANDATQSKKLVGDIKTYFSKFSN
jgi:HPt (histidine-containing phosphotransfer) domain-containing protein